MKNNNQNNRNSNSNVDYDNENRRNNFRSNNQNFNRNDQDNAYDKYGGRVDSDDRSDNSYDWNSQQRNQDNHSGYSRNNQKDNYRNDQWRSNNNDRMNDDQSYNDGYNNSNSYGRNQQRSDYSNDNNFTGFDNGFGSHSSGWGSNSSQNWNGENGRNPQFDKSYDLNYKSGGDATYNQNRNFSKWNQGNDSNTSYGQHKGKGPKGYKRSDERIKEDINDRLSDDMHIDASNVEVKVESGDVTLTGNVRDRWSKRHAEDLTETISGVNNVENRIRVSQENSSSTQSGKDDQRKTNINSSTEKHKEKSHLN